MSILLDRVEAGHRVRRGVSHGGLSINRRAAIGRTAESKALRFGQVASVGDFSGVQRGRSTVFW